MALNQTSQLIGGVNFSPKFRVLEPHLIPMRAQERKALKITKNREIPNYLTLGRNHPAEIVTQKFSK